MFINQDAVQGFHWENSQATLHPFVVYYRNTNQSRESQSLCVVWDHQKHNQSAVHSFLVVALSFVKSQLPLKVIYFSDGAASQYKNYKTFFKLFHEQDHTLKTEWHFFATRNGKSPCDGVRGTVKHLVANASLKAQYEFILTLMQLYEWATKRDPFLLYFFRKCLCKLYQIWP